MMVMEHKKTDKEVENKPDPEHRSLPLVPPEGGDSPFLSEMRDKLEMAEAMAELFDEDKVEHRHGSAQPEAD